VYLLVGIAVAIGGDMLALLSGEEFRPAFTVLIPLDVGGGLRTRQPLPSNRCSIPRAAPARAGQAWQSVCALAALLAYSRYRQAGAVMGRRIGRAVGYLAVRIDGPHHAPACRAVGWGLHFQQAVRLDSL
jgi:hypothetical protein